ncbi:MAG: hypothetical protein PVG93_06260 [Phycisphaerales bacterium]|jgi:hypothetical protein
MKKCATVVSIVLFSLLIEAPATAEDDGLNFEITSDFFSKYVWRGQLLNDDFVYQPGVSIATGPFTFGIWGNLDTTNINDRSGDFSEVDYYFDYSGDFPGLEGVSYSLGLIYYDFPGSGADGSRVPDTTEFYWGLGFDLPLNPSITVYHDLDEAEGTYVNLGLSHSIENFFEITPDIPVGLEISGGLGWASGSYNKYYWGTDQSKLQDFSISVSLPMEIAGWGFTPSFNYVTLVSDDIRDQDTYGTDSDFFFVGLSLSKSF